PEFTDKNIALEGFFQSELYFNHCADKIRNFYYKPSKEIADYANKIYTELSENGKLRLSTLQVRRDDYLLSNGYHTVQPIEYYEKGIKMLLPQTDKFVVFCDNSAEEWCKEHFKDKIFVMAPHDNFIGDIFVMSKCQNYLLANSSFSWWGAWLN